MTYQEYINQLDPIKLPIGSVILKKEDCVFITKYNDNKRISIVYPSSFGKILYHYTTKKNGFLLYTIDEHGNPLKPTVFSIDFD